MRILSFLFKGIVIYYLLGFSVVLIFVSLVSGENAFYGHKLVILFIWELLTIAFR